MVVVVEMELSMELGDGAETESVAGRGRSCKSSGTTYLLGVPPLSDPTAKGTL